MGIFDRLKKKQPSSAPAHDHGTGGDSVHATDKAALDEKPVAAAAPAAPAWAWAKEILRWPVVTEKSTLAQSQNIYTFMVAKAATKSSVKSAVKAVYGVRPSAVHMINVQGKWIRFGKAMGRRSDYKKALVTLPKGKTITIHQGV